MNKTNLFVIFGLGFMAFGIAYAFLSPRNNNTFLIVAAAFSASIISIFLAPEEKQKVVMGIILMLAFASFFIQIKPATSTITNINVSADAEVWTPDGGNGAGSAISVHPDDFRSWLKFSLSSLPTGIEISSAEVWLYYYYDLGSYANVTGEISFSSSDSWTEDEITWTTQPSFGATITSQALTDYGWYSWNVTTQIQNEYAGDKTASFVLRDSVLNLDEFALFRSKEYGVNIAYLKVTYYYKPTNDELTFTDPDVDSTTALAQHKAYSFRTKHTDTDGGTNINYVEITLDYGGEGLKFRWTESTDTFSEITDPMGYVTISSTSGDSSLSGNQWTLIWKITFDWDYPDESLHNIRLYTLDDNGYNDDDLYNDKYRVENDLASSGLTVNDYRVNPSQSLSFNGYWYYQGSASIAPPDGNYHVKVKLGVVEKGEDATMVSGAFSLSGIAAESNVNSYVYTTTADYMTGAGSFPTVVVDKVAVIIAASDTTPAINQSVTFAVSGSYAYDSSSVSTLSFQITRNGSNYASSTPFYDNQSSFVLYTYTTSAANDTGYYGITSFTTNTLSVGWGYSYSLFGAYNENGIRSGAINVTFYRTNQAAQSILLDGSYTFQAADYEGSVFSFELGYNQSRTYYLRLPEEDIYVFEPNSPYYTYFFSVIDMAGIHNGYLESLINVNGTDRVVERWSLNILNDIPFTMEWSRAYTMKLVADEGTYVFGTFVAGAKSSFQLTVYKALFPEDLTAIEGVYINALRINDTRIQINYTDTLLLTNWVQVRVYQLPAKQLAYTTNNTGQTQMINWDLANPVADYWVVVTASSQQWNQHDFQFVLSALTQTQNPFEFLDWLGTAPFLLSQVVGFGIVLLVFGVFSKEHAAIAGIIGVLIAAVLTVIGLLSIAASWLAVTMGVAILVAISINRKKAESGVG